MGLRKKRLDYGFILEWLCKKNILSGKIKSKIEQIIGKLNKYIHGETLEVLKPTCPACPAMVKLNWKDYEECVEYFQTVVSHILSLILEAYIIPSELTSDKDVLPALRSIKNLKTLEEIIGTKMIFSKELEKLISKINSII